MEKINTANLSLYTITWPIFIEMALQMLLRTTDIFMLSKVSDEAVAAVGVANQIIMFAVITFQFVAMGSAVVVSQYLGAKRTKKTGRIIGTALGLNLLFGLFVSSIVIIFNKPLLGIFNLDAELYEMAQTYLYITGGALVLQALFTVTVAIIQSYGDTKRTMLVTLGMNLCNIIGNYLVIFGPFGFPKLGVTGVAIVTVVSQMAGLIVILPILRKGAGAHMELRNIVFWQRSHVFNILKIGVPSAAVSLSYNANQLVITVFISSLGAMMLTTYIYTKNLMLIVMIMGLSLARGMQIIVGHLVGGGEQKKAYKRVLQTLLRSIFITLAAVLLLSLFREPLIKLFTTSPEIIKVASILLLLGFGLEPARNFNVILERSLQAAGDARFAMNSSVLIMWLFSVPLTYFLGIHMEYGLFGIFAAFIIDEWVRGLVLFFRWRSKKWKGKILIQPKDEKVSVG
ncbi:MATE family efflux transporter [Gracilibacillus alcaliphilus]|uniref:MATE family efflux transporter n=1 Tax=Gracilibacillus alcaliphilus TaxID=1401441 RepID=UPI001959036B|nr:MATE family efflux transporter [Gracilibacillus alcaliphilus]MBM7678200.1 putative MATE family efflux protein [Gracilibacillus alcaliphilus]